MKYIAKISWLTENEGGRKNGIPFNTDRYAPLIRIDSQNNMNEKLWSLVVNNYEMIDARTTLAKVYYLIPEHAPDNLAPELRFELCEGNRLIAFGTILKEFYE